MKAIGRFIFVAVLLILTNQVYAQQVEYHFFDKRDGIKIEYRWARANLFDRNSDAVLYLQMTNENEYPVNIVYDLVFYRDEQLYLESAGNTLCLSPGQRRRGSRTDMRFSAEGITLPMIEEDWFDWDLIVFDVKEASCK